MAILSYKEDWDTECLEKERMNGSDNNELFPGAEYLNKIRVVSK